MGRFKIIVFSFFLCCFPFGLFGQANPISPSSVEEFSDQGFPRISIEKLDSLHREFFIYAVLEGLPQWYTEEQHIQLIKKLRPEIKELYFWSFLDGQVSNGGFMQFFENGFAYMIPEIKNLYQRIGDLKGLDILIEAEEWGKGLTEESWIDEETNMLDNAYFDHAKVSRGIVEGYVRANLNLYVRDEQGRDFAAFEIKN